MKTLLITLLLVSCSTSSARHLPLDTVNYVDLSKYLGKWYEIARYEQKFQKDCTAVTANYSLKENGEIEVINSCRKFTPTGELKTAKARAWITDDETNAKLKVQFFLRSIRIPLFAGDYWILELDDDYQYAIIGDPSRKYLWFLSRTEKIDSDLYEYLIKRAEEMSFDTSKLIKTIH
ncbi:putative exported protein [Halobacteriovorax marinus SJ]|uniref:Exported protein n=1 Tax=Halobacteriovorax marinus (strain ATCC BAA-682 / DSM 15412 / SJ) TaxID=862908 RepID=E1X657_HALMS|nr:lipocalin family protein [Halobacteriovorax marinus]CBW27401.1 putative exported protein [Halobacteriovorax marinus SJ]